MKHRPGEADGWGKAGLFFYDFSVAISHARHCPVWIPKNPLAVHLAVLIWAFIHIAIGKSQNPVAGSFDMRMVKMFAMLELSCLFGRL